jgi:7-keto-8-aminopelargonate synthetase-like enzyme
MDTRGSTTQVLPLVVGAADDAVRVCERALEKGIFAQAIRPPTVPPGTSRLRLTAMATHRIAELRQAGQLIGETARKLGLARSAPLREAA